MPHILSFLFISLIVQPILSFPEPNVVRRDDAPAAVPASPTPTDTATASSSPGQFVSTTVFDSSTYTLTYVSPTDTATQTGGWPLIPPVVPIPFAPPPVAPPPGPEPPQPPGPDPPHDGPQTNTPDDPTTRTDNDDGQSSSTSASSVCSTTTATFGFANCTELIWVASHTLSSSISTCSTEVSTTSGCDITTQTGVSTNTVHFDTEQATVTTLTDDGIPNIVSAIPDEPKTLDFPDLAGDLVQKELGFDTPVDPPRGKLDCAEKKDGAPSFNWNPVTANIMDFCGQGLDITEDGTSKNYTSNGGTVVQISSKYAVNDTCPAGGKTTWDESRCKYLLNRPLLECEPNGQEIPAPPMYGGTILADCVETTITPYTTQNLRCGPFKDGNGTPQKPFTADIAKDAIKKYCDIDHYQAVADRVYDTPKDGIKLYGYARDKFQYAKGKYCTTTAPRRDISDDDHKTLFPECSWSDIDLQMNVGVQFDPNQTGCQPKKDFTVPRGEECEKILNKVADGCKLDDPDYGGLVSDNSDFGCLQWIVAGQAWLGGVYGW